ncbi:MAG TPA: hypothetical protein VEY50_04745 [Lysobacter sp.]|nr:hypothetical protein [Lysobacter sp.]
MPSAPRATLPTLLLAAVLAACGGCAPAPAPPARELAGMLLDAQLSEVSGLAASRRHRNVLWMHDDGGNPARLFAVDEEGNRLATLRVEGVTKTDWEDIASFELDGRSYLLIADVGDNGGLRRTLQLHVIEEPARIANGRVRPAWSIAFRWPDGARDCEAVAVDAARGEVLLVSKRRRPPELFSLPLRPPGVERITARRIGVLGGMPQPDERQRREDPQGARLQTQVTAADLAPDGRTLAVLTYRHVLLYPRSRAGWRLGLRTPSAVLELPWLPQAEALGWSRDGHLYVTGEFVPAPLYRLAHAPTDGEAQ